MILRLHRSRKLTLYGSIAILVLVLIVLFTNVQQEAVQAQLEEVGTPLKDGQKSKLPPLSSPRSKARLKKVLEKQLIDDKGETEADSENLLERKKELQDLSPLVTDKGGGVVIYEKSPFQRPKLTPLNHKREKAALFSLVRNSDLYGILQSIRQVEDRFNKNYHYDWVFVNDMPFTERFKKVVNNLCSGKVKFVELTSEFWTYPEWIDKDRLAQVREDMGRKKIKYGASESYRHMCRFNSGLFYKLPLLDEYKYYWRVEPDIEYHCDIDYDPFTYMRENNKVYGFTLAPLEIHNTVTSLWGTVQNYSREFPENVAPANNMLFLTDDDGETFNMCHFWSNFEIGDLDFFRSERYNHFFEYLDRSGGIYYERWGDLPIHTMAVSMLVPADQLLYVPNTGYFHNPNGDCPRSLDVRLEKNCHCNPRYDLTWSLKSCIPKFFDVHGLERPDGLPKRKYRPIHNWEQVLKEEERREKALSRLEEQSTREALEQLEREKLIKGVEGEAGVDGGVATGIVDDSLQQSSQPSIVGELHRALGAEAAESLVGSENLELSTPRAPVA